MHLRAARAAAASCLQSCRSTGQHPSQQCWVSRAWLLSSVPCRALVRPGSAELQAGSSAVWGRSSAEARAGGSALCWGKEKWELYLHLVCIFGGAQTFLIRAVRKSLLGMAWRWSIHLLQLETFQKLHWKCILEHWIQSFLSLRNGCSLKPPWAPVFKVEDVLLCFPRCQAWNRSHLVLSVEVGLKHPCFLKCIQWKCVLMGFPPPWGWMCPESSFQCCSVQPWAHPSSRSISELNVLSSSALIDHLSNDSLIKSTTFVLNSFNLMAFSCAVPYVLGMVAEIAQFFVQLFCWFALLFLFVFRMCFFSAFLSKVAPRSIWLRGGRNTNQN